jgi:hypothetical protein
MSLASHSVRWYTVGGFHEETVLEPKAMGLFYISDVDS